MRLWNSLRSLSLCCYFHGCLPSSPVPAEGRCRDSTGSEFHGLRLSPNHFEVVAACWMDSSQIGSHSTKLLQIRIVDMAFGKMFEACSIVSIAA